MIREVLTLSDLRGRPADEVAAIWALRRSEGMSPQETAVFEEWCRLDQAHAAAWERVQRSWAGFDAAQGDELLDAMREHARAPEPRRSSAFGMAAAAALLVAVSTSAILLVQGEWGHDTAGNGTPSQMAGSEGRPGAPKLQYANGEGPAKFVSLPDGSRVTLDAGTLVTGDFARSRRQLRLVRGRAFFAVKPDAARPFTVDAGELRVTALGTRFDVRIRRDELAVVLVEGRVSVGMPASASPPVLMKSGQQLTMRSGGPARLFGGGTEEALAWQQGYAVFDNTALADAAADLNRYPGAKLVVKDPVVARLPVSGMFRTGDPERFGRAVERIHPVRLVRRNAGEFEIIPAT
ncbi:MAG TPA: FecR domain-containing protein [Allosphingosinicella sp.]|jgi:transmembrane sensor